MYNLKLSEEDLRILHEIIYIERGKLMPLIAGSADEERKILRKREHRLTKIDKRIKKYLYGIMVDALI